MQKSQPVTEKTQQQTDIPAWLSNAAQTNIRTAQNLPGYTPFTGQGVAPLTQDQLTAFGMARGNVGQGSAISLGAVPGATNAMNFAAPQVSTADIGSNIQGLLNPYVGAQIGDATKELERQRQIQEQRNGGAAAAGHAFGGDRQGVVDAMNDRDYTTLKNNAITGLLSGSYDKALGTATSVAQGNQNAALTGANINLAGTNSLASLGPLLQSLGINDVNSLLGTGAVQQQNQQAGNTFNYNEFLRQQGVPYQNLQATTSAIGSAPHGLTSNGTTTKDVYSNPLAGIAGLGIAGLGFMTGNPMMGMSGLSGLLGSSNPSTGFTGNSTNAFSGIPGATTSFMGGIPYPMFS